MFTEPKEDSTLWRYLDFAKFCSMLQRKAVYFSNPSEFSDKQEGKLVNAHEISMNILADAITSVFEGPFQNLDKLPLPEPISKYRYIATMGAIYASKAGYENRDDINKYILNLEKLLITSDKNAIIELGQLEAKVARKLISDRLPQLFAKPIFIYCWHENAVESEGMWRIYGNKGLAIKSTPAKLKASITLPQTSNTHACVSALNYVHYVDDPAAATASLMAVANKASDAPSDDPFFQHVMNSEIYKSYLLKHSAYRHENEVRFIHQEVEKGPPNIRDPQSIFKGKYMAADLPTMITEIVISPYADDWFVEVVKGVIAQAGVELRVKPSSLNL